MRRYQPAPLEGDEGRENEEMGTDVVWPPSAPELAIPSSFPPRVMNTGVLRPNIIEFVPHCQPVEDMEDARSLPVADPEDTHSLIA